MRSTLFTFDISFVNLSACALVLLTFCMTDIFVNTVVTYIPWIASIQNTFCIKQWVPHMYMASNVEIKWMKTISSMPITWRHEEPEHQKKKHCRYLHGNIRDHCDRLTSPLWVPHHYLLTPLGVYVISIHRWIVVCLFRQRPIAWYLLILLVNR